MSYLQKDYDKIQHDPNLSLGSKAVLIQQMLEEDGHLVPISKQREKIDKSLAASDIHLKDENGLYKIEEIGVGVHTITETEEREDIWRLKK